MGDRANVHVYNDYDTNGVYLYTHWGGTELPVVVQNALKRGEDRWDDGPYLTRIIFCEMLSLEGGKHALTGTTGYGISSAIGDGRDRVIHVNTSEGLIVVEGWGGYDEDSLSLDGFEGSFDDFLNMELS